MFVELPSGPCVGTMLSEWYSPNAPRLFAAAGLSFAIVDCEHGAFDYSALSAMTACASAVGFPLVVRVPKIDRECLLKYLDMGAAGVLVPMLETPEDAARVVEFTRYMPLGKRGISTRRAHTDYRSLDMNTYMAEANRRVLVMAQIETREGLRNVEAIAATPGLSALLVGPNDLSADLGDFGNYATPAMREALLAVHRAAASNHIRSGIISSDMGLLRECLGMGMTLVSWGSELSILHGTLAKTANLLTSGESTC